MRSLFSLLLDPVNHDLRHHVLRKALEYLPKAEYERFRTEATDNIDDLKNYYVLDLGPCDGPPEKPFSVLVHARFTPLVNEKLRVLGTPGGCVKSVVQVDMSPPYRPKRRDAISLYDEDRLSRVDE